MLKFKQNPILWAWTLLSSVIGGGATALTSWGGLALANASGMKVSVPNFQELQIIFISGAITAAVAYLVKSPLPALVDEDTVIIKKEDT